MNKNLRNQITRYSFLLTVFVIWLHAGEPLLSSIPGQIAVPGFFMLSGFLFFLHPEAPAEEKLPKWLTEKLCRRGRTLLIPYLLWNFLYFVIYLLAGKAQLSEFFAAVFHYSCNPVFWYLYQLILISLLSPLLWLVLKRKCTAVCWLILIFLAAVFYGPLHEWFPVDLINADALFYFSLGGFSSLYLYKKETEQAESPVKAASADEETAVTETAVTEKAAPETTGSETGGRAGRVSPDLIRFLCCSGILILAELSVDLLPAGLINIGVITSRVSGAAALWFLLKLLPEMPPKPWMYITFFVYATHYMVIRAVWQAEIALGLNESAAANIVTYLLMPVFAFGTAWLLYIIMKKYTPKLLKLLTGGRG